MKGRRVERPRLEKKKKKSKVKERKGKERDTEWQTATKGPRQLCHEAGKAKKEKRKKEEARREREKSREDWMKMASDIIERARNGTGEY